MAVPTEFLGNVITYKQYEVTVASVNITSFDCGHYFSQFLTNIRDHTASLTIGTDDCLTFAKVLVESQLFVKGNTGRSVTFWQDTRKGNPSYSVSIWFDTTRPCATPLGATMNVGASVLLFDSKNNRVGFIVGKRGFASLRPAGGSGQRNEFPQDIAIRELEEELGLKVNKEDLKLLSISEWPKNQGAASCNYCYYIDVSGIEWTPKIQEDEILDFVWLNGELINEAAGDYLELVDGKINVDVFDKQYVKANPERKFYKIMDYRKQYKKMLNGTGMSFSEADSMREWC